MKQNNLLSSDPVHSGLSIWEGGGKGYCSPHARIFSLIPEGNVLLNSRPGQGEDYTDEPA